MALSIQDVVALAPDESSAKAARGLLSPGGWPLLGASEAALWGECQGSGSKPYQTQVDRSGPAFRCSCPSRKFPCKHGLALLMLHVQSGELFKATEPPAWVSDWLGSRAEKAQKKEEKQQAASAAPPDPEAAARREAQRWQRITQGCDDLQRFLADQLARGLGALNAESRKSWLAMAARLVDAQAPGLAQRLREAATLIQDGSADWPERLLHSLGLVQLLLEALRRRGQLDAAMQAELRSLIGWPQDKAELLAAGERVDDRWAVVGCISEERDDRLTERRVWLHGAQSGRRACLLDHAFGGSGFEQAWTPGSEVQAGLVFYPGTAGLRALCADGAQLAGDAHWAAAGSLEQEWQTLATRAAACPWTGLHPLLLRGAVLQQAGERRVLRVEGQVLPVALPDEQAWRLLACQGGTPLDLMAEWDGRSLRPLSAWDAAARRPVWQWGTPA